MGVGILEHVQQDFDIWDFPIKFMAKEGCFLVSSR